MASSRAARQPQHLERTIHWTVRLEHRIGARHTVNLRTSPAVAGISDTSLWIAAIRAAESGRRDAIFTDSLAAMLAGDRGRAIANSFPRASMVAWGVVARTSAIDRLIEHAVRCGVDTVVNLGAGLDTRPYRLPLPATLRWIELDFPHLLDYKSAKLKEEAPACKLERIGIDLTDKHGRNAVLAGIGASSSNMLVLAEGVITYLSNRDVTEIAHALHAVAGFRWWLMDFDNAGKRNLPRGWDKKLAAAPFLFETEDWFGFFSKLGWHPANIVTTGEESARIGRPYPWDMPYGLLMRVLPKGMRERILGLSGAVLLRNA